MNHEHINKHYNRAFLLSMTGIIAFLNIAKFLPETKEFWRPLDNEAEDKLNKLKSDLDLDINSSSHSISKVM